MFKTWKKFASRPEPVDVIDVVPVLDRSLAYRRFLRSVFQAPARLTLAGYMREVQVLDVSLKGALVDMGAVLPCPVGTRGRLRLLLSPTTFIAMERGCHARAGQSPGPAMPAHRPRQRHASAPADRAQFPGPDPAGPRTFGAGERGGLSRLSPARRWPRG